MECPNCALNIVKKDAFTRSHLYLNRLTARLRARRVSSPSGRMSAVKILHLFRKK